MKRTRLNPIDIVGFTLGAIVLVVVIASIAIIVNGHGFSFQWNGPWNGPDMKGFWNERKFHHGALREEKDEQIAGNFTTVEIRNIAGQIDIRGGGGDGVGVHSVKTAMFPAAMENLGVGIEKRGDRLVIEEQHTAGFVMSAGTVSFDITLPKGVRTIEAHSVSGSVTVQDVPAGMDQTLSTISGSISTSQTGNLAASSTSGSVQFVFAGNHLDAHTVSGSIEGQIQSLNKGGSVTMRTVSGSVDVGAYSGLDASVSLQSVSGGVSCDFPLTATQQKRNMLEGTIGTGAGKVEVMTTSGTITVRKM